MKITPVCLLSAVFLLAGCSFSAEDQAPAQVLPGSSWRLERIEFEGHEDWIPGQEDIGAIRFGIDGSVQLRANCNGCGSGNYTIDGDRIVIRGGSCTEAGCVRPSNAHAYPGLVSNADRVEVDGGVMVLDGAPVATFPRTRLHHRRVLSFPDRRN